MSDRPFGYLSSDKTIYGLRNFGSVFWLKTAKSVKLDFFINRSSPARVGAKDAA